MALSGNNFTHSVISMQVDIQWTVADQFDIIKSQQAFIGTV